MQAADQLVEDFGEGTLVQGKATVKLDPDFAGLLQGAKYQVFLTPEGDCNGLYVDQQVGRRLRGPRAEGRDQRRRLQLPHPGEAAAPGRQPAGAGGPGRQRRAHDAQQDDNAPKPVQPHPGARRHQASGAEAARRVGALTAILPRRPLAAPPR